MLRDVVGAMHIGEDLGHFPSGVVTPAVAAELALIGKSTRDFALYHPGF
jgi:hypothetical protein